MFDIGWSELLVVGLVALIVIGPKELPAVLRTAGQWVGKIKRMASEFQGQFQEALREAEVVDLKKEADDLTNSLKGINEYDPMADTAKEEEVSSEWDTPYETPEETEPTPETVVHPEPAAEPEPAAAAPVVAVEEVSSPPVLEKPEPPAKPEHHAEAETPPPKQAGGSA